MVTSPGRWWRARGGKFVNGYGTRSIVDVTYSASQIHGLNATAAFPARPIPDFSVWSPGQAVNRAVVRRLGNFLSGTVDNYNLAIVTRRNVLGQREISPVARKAHVTNPAPFRGVKDLVARKLQDIDSGGWC